MGRQGDLQTLSLSNTKYGLPFMAETQSTSQPDSAQKGKLTPEQVRQVAEQVLALWRRDLAVERERQRYGQR